MPEREPEQIYRQPDTYDLEHSRAEPDIGFFCRLIEGWRPQRVLELACGNGRITLPLATSLARWNGEIVALDSNEQMLLDGKKKAAAARGKMSPITWVNGDLRTWHGDEPFDAVLCACSSMSHLLSLEDHTAAWRCAHGNLSPKGRFVVAEQMANFPTLAESQHNPPRVVLEIDSDTSRVHKGKPERLLRYRATRYFAHEQKATVRFLYDKLHDDSEVAERFISDYECHVFYPRELLLLFLLTGFSIETVWGDYHGEPLRENSRQMIICGGKL